MNQADNIILIWIIYGRWVQQYQICKSSLYLIFKFDHSEKNKEIKSNKYLELEPEHQAQLHLEENIILY